MNHSNRHFNDQQKAAIAYVTGPLLVLAGAGSGKTSVITEKVAHLIEHYAYKPHQILAVTFTNKASREMKSRIKARLAENNRGIMVSTFHTLGLNILKRDIVQLGYFPQFTLFDATDTSSIIREIVYEAFQGSKEQSQIFQTQISLWKNAFILPDQVHALEGSARDKILDFDQAVEVYKQYQAYLKAYNAIDFDDLILLSVQLLHKHTSVREYWQNKIRYLLVDEYQDTNDSQYRLIQYLVGNRKRFTVVGDDDQSIYAWRGARPENLTILQQDFPDLKVIKLEQNYRSTQTILHAANQVIQNNPHLFEKVLWSHNNPGESIRILSCKDEHHEAMRVASDILTAKLNHNKQYGEYAILYRSNHQAYPLERQLQGFKIPYHITGGSSFFEKAEIKDITAYLKLIVNPEDDRSLLRIINTPKRRIGTSTISGLSEYSAQRNRSFYYCIPELGLKYKIGEKGYLALQEFHGLIDAIRLKLYQSEIQTLQQNIGDFITQIGYRDWLVDTQGSDVIADKKYQNIQEFISFIAQDIQKQDPEEVMEKSIVERLQMTLQKLMLIDLLDGQSEQSDDNRVQLITLHAAKGLEFPYAYIIGLEEGYLPHHQSVEEEKVEEERRLMYVGVTRAQHRLTLSYATKRKRNGEIQDCQPSRFLSEMPEESLHWVDKQPEMSQEEKKGTAKQYLSAMKSLLNGT